jgi:prepilin-type N-terminal cleavage/methylation domain-containing protein
MVYIHEMENALSSKLAFAVSFSLSLGVQAQYYALLITTFMSQSSPPPVQRAFTLIELLIVMATIAILAAILIPSLNSALESAKATKDLSNLRQIGTLMQSYLNDKDQILPAAATWAGTNATPVLYPKYLGTRRVFQSPFDKRPGLETDLAPVSYGINANMYAASPGISGNMLKVASPASTFFMAPVYNGDPANISSWTGNATNAPNLPAGGTGEPKGTHRSGQKIDVLFCDWHTETLTFGPGTTSGTFQDWQSVPLGVKHWDPTQ